MVDGNFPCGLCMSVLCVVLVDARAFIGVGRLTGSKGSGHRLYRRGAGTTDILAPEEPLGPRNGGKLWLQGQGVSARASVLIWSLTDGHPNLVPNRALCGLSEPLGSHSSQPL